MILWNFIVVIYVVMFWIIVICKGNYKSGECICVIFLDLELIFGKFIFDNIFIYLFIIRRIKISFFFVVDLKGIVRYRYLFEWWFKGRN